MDLPFYIENRDGFRVVGYLMKTTNQKGQGRKAIPLHWSNFRKDNLETRMLALAEQKADGLFGINLYNTDLADSRKFEYMIAVPSDEEAPEELTEYTVPADLGSISVHQGNHRENRRSGNHEMAAKIEIQAVKQRLYHRQDEVQSA